VRYSKDVWILSLQLASPNPYILIRAICIKPLIPSSIRPSALK
jgi:hypothetical protein